jgi:hypothetical protein
MMRSAGGPVRLESGEPAHGTRQGLKVIEDGGAIQRSI